MASHFQVAPLVASPLYPNSVAWSEDNLLAIASGHLVTILNPAQLDGARDTITISPSPPFNIGKIEKEDLLNGCILPICLSRDARCHVRSISWSQQGMASNGGCLLAVCTTDGRVKLYRAPTYEMLSEWVEVVDISEMLYNYFVEIQFGEAEIEFSPERTSGAVTLRERVSSDLLKHCPNKRVRKKRKGMEDFILTEETSCDINQDSNDKNFDEETVENLKSTTVNTTSNITSCSTVDKGASVEVLKENGHLRFWVRGIVDQVDVGRVLVKFSGTSADEMQEEWVSLGIKSDKKNGSKISVEDTIRQGFYFQKIRPCINAGNLPKDLVVASLKEITDVITEGQLVEAWIRNRWVEGCFAGFNDSKVLVNFPGNYGCIALDPDSIRIAPIWIEKQKSWSVTVVKIEGPDMLAKHHTANGFPKSKLLANARECHQFGVHTLKEKRTRKWFLEDETSVITPDQYASRSGLLASLVVSWSPKINSSFEGVEGSPASSIGGSAILAMGSKAGKVSLWRVFEPPYYTVEHLLPPPEVSFIGMLQAHKSWVTAATWTTCSVYSSARLDPDSSRHKLILATGSTDGSVSMWHGDACSLSECVDTFRLPLSLLKEVVPADAVPVSSLSLVSPSSSPEKVVIAIGKGSGQISVWVYNMSEGTIYKAGCDEAHDQVVTGLAWAFDGHCLYSCSQDNTIQSWQIHGSSLVSVPFPHASCGLSLENSRNTIDLPSHVFDSCFGLAVSPGNLTLAAVRNIDTDLVDPMYQSRSQKGATEFFWIGGQQLQTSASIQTANTYEMNKGLTMKDACHWEYNVIWSLKFLEDDSKPLVFWDVLKALATLKYLSLELYEMILSKWLSSWIAGGGQMYPLEKCLTNLPKLISKASCRRLHMLVIMGRRLQLLSNKEEQPSVTIYDADNKEPNRQDYMKVWKRLLQISEDELRERLVFYTFSAILRRVSYTQSKNSSIETSWIPAGALQMEKWISLNSAKISEPLNQLAGRIRELGPKRIASISESVASERCIFCNATVQLKCPEVAYCQTGSSSAGEGHKLQRCAVSMQVCPPTPLWFCICCERWALKGAPENFFYLSSMQEVELLSDKSIILGSSKPLCPFCGILMQRFLPDFLLRASPV